MRKIRTAIARFFEVCGLRCSKCGSWKSVVSEERKREWGVNFGGMLLMDPFCLTIRRRKCDGCDHVMTSKVVSCEAVA